MGMVGKEMESRVLDHMVLAIVFHSPCFWFQFFGIPSPSVEDLEAGGAHLAFDCTGCFGHLTFA